ncbi:hypothetical protein [Methanolobus sp.]|uniref:hypothetical protein n=1 Tax=Methanolobus sp. TaxID=1874737 RepID=UPI0025DDC024|nr:hypothetical protein [Methanolobus sp.]
MKKFNDCQLKGLILQCLIDGPKTSEQINSVINLPNNYDKHNLHAELYVLKRRGYLSRNSETRSYSLNKKGVVHAQNPYLSIIKRRESIASKVSAILENEESFKAAVDEAVSRKSGGTISSGSGGVISSPTSSVNDSKVMEELQKKDQYITKLEKYIHHLQKTTQSQSTVPQQQSQQQPERVQQQTKTTDPEKAKSEARRIKKRKQLAHAYYSKGVYLDSRFFSLWGEVAPHKIKFKRYTSSDGTVTPDSIEIMSSKSNSEIRRGHAHKKPISEALLRRCMFHIVKIDDTGIDIIGHGLPDNRARLRY